MHWRGNEKKKRDLDLDCDGDDVLEIDGCCQDLKTRSSMYLVYKPTHAEDMRRVAVLSRHG